MDTKVVLALGGGLALGTIIGFGVGYYISGSEVEDKYIGEVEFLNSELRKYRDLLKEAEDRLPDDVKKKISPDVAKPKEPSKMEPKVITDYTKFVKHYEYGKSSEPNDIVDDVDSDSPPEDEPDEDVDEYMSDYEADEENEKVYDDIYEESKKAYVEKYGESIQMLGDECSHKDFPDFRYEDYSELHFFVDDGVMTDDSGTPVDQEEYVGQVLKRTHWLEGNDDRVWIRNNPKQHDYLLNKHRVSSEDYWVRGIDG